MKLEIKNNLIIAHAESIAENKKILSLLEEDSNEKLTEEVSPNTETSSSLKKNYKRQILSSKHQCRFCGKKCRGACGKASHENWCRKNPNNYHVRKKQGQISILGL